MVIVGVANRAITPLCPHVHTLIFRDLQFFSVSDSYEAFTRNWAEEPSVISTLWLCGRSFIKSGDEKKLEIMKN